MPPNSVQTPRHTFSNVGNTGFSSRPKSSGIHIFQEKESQKSTLNKQFLVCLDFGLSSWHLNLNLVEISKVVVQLIVIGVLKREYM